MNAFYLLPLETKQEISFLCFRTSLLPPDSYLDINTGWWWGIIQSFWGYGLHEKLLQEYHYQLLISCPQCAVSVFHTFNFCQRQKTCLSQLSLSPNLPQWWAQGWRNMGPVNPYVSRGPHMVSFSCYNFIRQTWISIIVFGLVRGKLGGEPRSSLFGCVDTSALLSFMIYGHRNEESTSIFRPILSEFYFSKNLKICWS